MLPCLEGEGCDLLINRSGWTCTQPGGRIKTTTVCGLFPFLWAWWGDLKQTQNPTMDVDRLWEPEAGGIWYLCPCHSFSSFSGDKSQRACSKSVGLWAHRDRATGLVGSEVKPIQCILLAPKLLGFVGGGVELHQVPSKPKSKGFFLTSPKAKGTMRIQACGALQMVVLLPQTWCSGCYQNQELQYLTHLVPLSRAH